MPALDPSYISEALAIVAWVFGNSGVLLGLVGLSRRPDLLYLALIITALALLANAGIVRLFI